MEEIKSIRISELKDFKNHPFHVQQDMEMCALMKSIEEGRDCTFACKTES